MNYIDTETTLNAFCSIPEEKAGDIFSSESSTLGDFPVDGVVIAGQENLPGAVLNRLNIYQHNDDNLSLLVSPGPHLKPGEYLWMYARFAGKEYNDERPAPGHLWLAAAREIPGDADAQGMLFPLPRDFFFEDSEAIRVGRLEISVMVTPTPAEPEFFNNIFQWAVINHDHSGYPALHIPGEYLTGGRLDLRKLDYADGIFSFRTRPTWSPDTGPAVVNLAYISDAGTGYTIAREVYAGEERTFSMGERYLLDSTQFVVIYYPDVTVRQKEFYSEATVLAVTGLNGQ